MVHPQPVIWLMAFIAVFGALVTALALLA